MEFEKLFYLLGLKTAQHPVSVIALSLVIVGITLTGLIFLDFELEPQKLWVSQTSQTNYQQLFFGKQFGAYFRVNQFVMRMEDKTDMRDLFQKEYLEKLFDLQEKITNTPIEFGGLNYTLDDFCYKPISGKGCMINSPTNFWHENITAMRQDEDIKETAKCLQTGDSGEMPCFDSIGTPIQLSAIFGKQGCEGNQTISECNICNKTARSMSVTMLLRNDFYLNKAAVIWERDVFQKFVKNFNNQEEEKKSGLKIYYMTERSVSDELEIESSQNVWVVVISYLVMFIYISVMMGEIDCLNKTRVLVGLGGIIVVALSCLSSFAIVSFFGIKQSLISAEVVPFLVLAIGADNMFIITSARDRRAHLKVLSEQQGEGKKNKDEVELAEAIKEVGPSITTAAFGEFLSFLVGYFTDIPALESFCLCASFAVLINYLLQMTVFVAFLSLDDKRIASRRIDVLPIIRVNHNIEHSEGKLKLQTFISTTYYKIITNKYFVIFAIILYSFMSILSLLVAFATMTNFSSLTSLRFPLGLNQQTTVTQNSDLFNYFKTQEEYVDIGSPGYLVFYNIDYNNQENLKLIDEMSDHLSTLSSVVPPVYSWYKDFKKFMDPYYSDKCNPKRNVLINQSLQIQIQEFLKMKVDEPCCTEEAICGEQYSSDITFSETGEIESSRFRFMHAPLVNQSVYVNSILQTNGVAKIYTKQFQLIGGKNQSTTENYYNLNGENVTIPAVFPYSLFYVYYDQYLFIRGVCVQNLLIGLGIIFLAVQLVMNIPGAFVVVLFTFSCILHLIGVLWLMNFLPDYKVELNAVSVVNIVVALGLSVEFCCHIIIFYLRGSGEKSERVMYSLKNVGASVLIGIITTKIIGVSVLLFAPSKVFQIYYFRMYFFLILVGFFHGFVLLPLFLSTFDIGKLGKEKVEDEISKFAQGKLTDESKVTQEEKLIE